VPRRIFLIHSVFVFILCTVFVQAQGIITTIAGGGQFQVTWIGGPATNVPLGLIQGVATDSQGNVYASDASNFLVVKVAPSGVLTIVAGNGTAGTGGDGGPATSASLKAPGAVAADAAANVFFVDGNRVRKVTPQGVITTFAGSLNPGDSGDGGPATQALLLPQGLAVDIGGNLYISSGYRVRKVTPQGIISAFAGGGPASATVVDGVPALNAPLNTPTGITVDRTGVMYIAQSGDGRIRRVGTDGIITTIAGGSGRGFSGDGGPATAATLNAPTGLALDTAGDLYISDLYRIREITTDGMIHTVTGTGIPNFTGDQGPAALASLSQPAGVATDAFGSVYIADSANFRVRKIDSSGIITTYAGSGNLGFAGDGGQARDAVLNTPWGIVVDPAGNVLFSDAGNHRVRKIAPNGVITTIAGDSAPGFAGDGGPATQALLNGPLGLALDAAGNLYIADSQNRRVRKIDTSGVITTVAGSGSAPNPSAFDSGDGGRAVDATLSSVSDIALDTQGNLYIAENLTSAEWAIRRVLPDGTITTFASGLGQNVVSITVDAAGDVYFSASPAIRFGRPPLGAAFGLAPDGITPIAVPGPACGSPIKGAFDALGNFYLAEAGPPPPSAPGCTFNVVLQISPAGVVTTVAGMSPQAGFAGDDGPATGALLNSPTAVAFDAAGNLYIADTGNNRIRKVFLNPASGLFQPSLQKTLQPGYYIAAVTLGQGEHPGYWGMQVGTSSGVLDGGYNFGGTIQQSNRPPGYGGFYVPSAESVHFHVDAQAADGSSSSTVTLGVQLLDASKNPLLDPKFGGTAVDFTQPLSPGYYTLIVNGGANSPLENFQVSMVAPGFAGAANFGGFAAPASVGFGAFYLAAPQQVSIQVYGQPSLGMDAAGGLRLTLYDANRNVIATVP